MAKTPVAEDKALAKTETAVATSGGDMPDWLKEAKHEPRGLDEIDGSRMIMPRIAVCQSNTPHRKANNPKFIEGLQEGHIFNTLNGKNYKDVVRFIPLFFYVSRMMFKPFDQGGGLICQATNGHNCQLNNGGPCINAEWGKDGKPPECNELFNYPCLVLPDMDLAVVSFKRTHITSAGKPLNSFMRLRGGDAFSGIYEMTTTIDKKQGQDYFTPLVRVVGWVTQEQYKQAEAAYLNLHDRVKAGEVAIDAEGAAAEDAPAPGTTRDNTPF